MRIRFEKRLTPSRFMQVATPIASVLLTMLLGAIIFELIGFDGPHAIYETFITPIVASYKWQDVADQGRAADHHRARACRSATRPRSGTSAPRGSTSSARWPAPASPSRCRTAQGFWIIPLMIAAGIVGGMAWAAIPALLKTRYRRLGGALDPDARLCRAAGAQLSGQRPVEGSERPQLPADGAVHPGQVAAARAAGNASSRPASSSPSC